MSKNNQGGFSLIESILIVIVMVALGFTIYHFGWGARGEAGVTALETHLDILQKAMNLYVFDSNGLYPTDDGTLPDDGEYKSITWDAGVTTGGQRLLFYPDYVKRRPKRWDQGVWRIDSIGKISVTINPEDY